MVFVRSQAVAALLGVSFICSYPLALGIPSSQVSVIKVAGVSLCSNRSHDTSCRQGHGLDGFAIYAFGVTFQNGTDLWSPQSTYDGCTKQTDADIASKHAAALAWGTAEERITSGPIAWVKEITCNIVQYEVATFSADHQVTGVYNATASQACQFRIQNYKNEKYGDDQWWYPWRPGSYEFKLNPFDMTHNRSFTAKEGYQIVGVQMELGLGDLTRIPFGIIEKPVPSARNSSKNFLRI